jgi:hypothetical protein
VGYRWSTSFPTDTYESTNHCVHVISNTTNPDQNPNAGPW